MWEYMELEFSLLENPALVIFLVLLLLLTAFLAGAYPSFYISKFNPVNIFQDKLKIGGKNVLTIILLTFQFFDLDHGHYLRDHLLAECRIPG